MAIARGKHHWTEAKKIQVVTTYLALGKAPMVEAVTGVPRQTIRIWRMTQWWKDLEAEIRADEDSELDSKLSKIIDRSLDTVVDRIEHGDFILDSKSGTIKRVPVKMKDVHKVSTELLDKRNLIRGKPTQITQKITVEDVMQKLAAEFQRWSKGQGHEEKLIHGVPLEIGSESEEEFRAETSGDDKGLGTTSVRDHNQSGPEDSGSVGTIPTQELPESA